jgi:hypothetical protein
VGSLGTKNEVIGRLSLARMSACLLGALSPFA